MAGVSTTHETYDRLLPQWIRCRDTASGSDAVKAKGTLYLPPLDSHLKEGGAGKYQQYLLRATFYNAVGRTVAGLSGGIFQKAPTLISKDQRVQDHSKDITLTGEPLDMFSLKVTKEHLLTGRYGILVDLANLDSAEPRPYWVGYPAEDIINWRYERINGDQELVMVVLKEQVNVPDPKDEFNYKVGIQYRVLRLVGGIYCQQLYVQIQDSSNPQNQKYQALGIETPTRRGKALDFIPFALPWDTIEPPLLDLADVNLAHFRGTADLKHGLHFTALPTPWVSGVVDAAKPLQIGAGTAWALEKDGKAGMLEFTGKGLGAIRTDLQDMQRMMATLGARLLEEAPHYAETALSVSMRHSSDYANLRTIAQVVEQQISWCVQVHEWWIGNAAKVTDIKSGYELNKVFYDQQLTADELRALLLALQAGTISYKTFYARLSNTGWMREGVTDDEELKDIESDPSFVPVAAAPSVGIPKTTGTGTGPRMQNGKTGVGEKLTA